MGFSKQEYWSGLPFPSLDFPGGSDGKASVYNVGDPGSIPGLGRSSREGTGYPLYYSFLENSMNRGAWWAIAHRVAKSQTRLSGQHMHARMHAHVRVDIHTHTHTHMNF